MRVFTGDSVGSIKVTDLASKTVETVLKPTVLSRDMAVTFIARKMPEEGDEVLLLVGRATGLVECLDVLAPQQPLWACALPGRAIVFCATFADRLLAVTEGGWLLVIDISHPRLSGKEVGKIKLEGDEDDDPKVIFAEQMLAEASDWLDTTRRPAWVIDAHCLVDETELDEMEARQHRITCAFHFVDSQGQPSIGVAGYRLPLQIWRFLDSGKLEVAYATTHSGRIFERDRAPKIMAAGWLEQVADMDAFYSVDQRGKCRVYVWTRDLDASERSRGPIITFQITQENACPNLVRLMSTEFHYKSLGITPPGGDAEDDGDGESCDDDASTQADGGTEIECGSEAEAGAEGEADAEAAETESCCSSSAAASDDDGERGALEALEQRLLADDRQYCWCLGVGDAKGGAYVVRIKWEPNSATYERRMGVYDRTGQLEEFYDRTKIRRRMRVNRIHKIGQLIDTSPLDYGDRRRHEQFRAALEVCVPDVFKLIPGAVNCLEYSAEDQLVALAGLDRRLYIYTRSTFKWDQVAKINLKNKINAVLTTTTT